MEKVKVKFEKKEKRRGKNQEQELQLINPNAAGIDIGSEYHFVAVPRDRDDKPVRRFACFTSDLHCLAKWLKACRITTVAMESTGVYWIPVFQILESYGFDVKLINARNIKNVSGRKTDVQDCQWIQQLHSYGLLTASFRPENKVCIIRAYLRQRENLIKGASMHINRMQKAMTQMNIQLHKVISDITGLTGMKIIKAILAGERNTVVLASMKHPGIKSSHERIAKALEGDYREELLFVLKQELDLYEYYLDNIHECDKEIEQVLGSFETKLEDEEKIKESKAKTKREYKYAIHFDLHSELYRITGVDLTKINGIDALTAQTIISEIGLDMSKWENEKKFCSWLALCPHNKITGGKIKDSRTKKIKNRATTAFHLAARSVGLSNSALGAYYRRMKGRLGAGPANTATAHKLARIFYSMLKYGEEFVDFGEDYYEKQYKERVLKNLQRRAKQFGFSLVPGESPEKEKTCVGEMVS
jgi:transposase